MFFLDNAWILNAILLIPSGWLVNDDLGTWAGVQLNEDGDLEAIKHFNPARMTYQCTCVKNADENIITKYEFY